MKNYLALFIFGTVLFTSCEDKKSEVISDSKTEESKTESNKQTVTKPINLDDNFIVAGKIKEGIHAQLVVEANTPNGAVVVGEALANADGDFNIKGNIADMGMYQLRLVEYNANPQVQTPEKVIPLTLMKDDSVYVTVDFNNFESAPKYSGSKWAEPLNGYFDKLFDFINFQRNLKNPEKLAQDQIVSLIEKNKKPLDVYCKKQISNDPSNPANLILMKELYPIEYLGGFENWDKENIAVLKKMQDGYNKAYPSNPISAQIGMQVDQLESGYNEFISFSNMSVAPEISMNDVNGKKRSLSDLRGKIVLIDFWASWCGPCRKENPNVVKMYNKYKDKGFEIFSVSLDNDAEAWKRAIKADGLLWKNHVSDLQGWKTSVINTYKFNGIPYTVLIDKDGEIIEKGLRGVELERKLEDLLGK